MFLTQDELAEFTGRQKMMCQVRWLRSVGITHVVNEAGRLIVLKSHVVDFLSGNLGGSKAKKKAEPAFENAR
jgi:hypothetical protein